MQKQTNPEGAATARFLIRLTAVALGLSTGHLSLTWADTVYRCGEAYSASALCAHGPVSELEPLAEPHTPNIEKGNTTTDELREAQALEKRRLKSENQTIQSTPARGSVPSASLGAITRDQHLPQQPNSNKKRARKIQSPYFTAVAPNAIQKKKSTAQAVPANNP